ncbi:hypothetical protein KC867_02225, partial [Candidatus Saccharibacteria bacterium]|nr:hypothetical protein [Candidatus Saccharibacteria bacterium]
KHATAVFSGAIPSTLEFLKPEETIETNTDSLRDFIVSLDKSKADKLRYKVEENVVKIYITPYRTSISEADLEFTQGDFNVDVVIALGVTKREELDNAIMAHGRILHDATFITVTAGQDISELGQINWQDQAASSLSEMITSISESFKRGIIDEQIATALLTGIVSETERFSNPKTTPKVMTMSAQLMAAGANQQLIANELQKATEIIPEALPNAPETDEFKDIPQDSTTSSDGTLSIDHTIDDIQAETAKLKTIQDLESGHTPPSVPADALADASIADIATLASGSTPLPAPSEQSVSSMISTPSEVSQEALSDTGAEHVSAGLDSSVPSANQPSLGVLPPPPEAPATEPNVESVPVVEAPPVKDEPTPTPAPELEQAPAPEDDGEIHIDTDGNLLRKAAMQPKHKVLQPLPSLEEAEADLFKVQDEPEVIKPTVNADAGNQSESSANATPLTTGAGVELPTVPSAMGMTGTLADLEKAVDSPHLAQQAGVDSARNAVFEAHNDGSPTVDLLSDAPSVNPPESISYDTYRLPEDGQSQGAVSDVGENLPEDSQNSSITPPPVPPPMMPLG